ncbi:class I SAM-dependent methyltransferase [Pseudonocardia sp. CA-107938]|uniref:class I SAM-dependent methyltransferase n=1 Tax=Pseudonocardia sp. CA-107938 TaxID=3240021 RepID=UPI003D8A0FC4
MPRVKLVPEMEGPIARWYARQRSSEAQLVGVRASAARYAAELAAGADVLEVAPGPGLHAIELARLGLHVTGLDISATFVELATEAARVAGMDVVFVRGDAASLPFPDASFDLVVCQAAFKNFRAPRLVLDEMHRVLRDGGSAVVEDLRRDVSSAQIAEAVDAMGLSRANAAVTRIVLGRLRRRALPRAEFERLARQSRFGAASVEEEGPGLRVRLTRTRP